MKQRLLSLDVFRGATVAFMILVNNPGDSKQIYSPLEHAEWNGCTPTDCVFPFFLFIAGVSIVFSFQKIDELTYQKIIVRTLKLFLLGLFLNFFSKITFGLEVGIPLLAIRLLLTALIAYLLFSDFKLLTQLQVCVSLFICAVVLAFFVKDFESVRIPGVLQRIALVYFACSMIYISTNTRIQIMLLISILLAYWAMMTLVPVPNGLPANLEPTTNLGAWLDNFLLQGHLWVNSKIWDPEGILSTFPAIGTGLIGILTGTWIRSENSNAQKITGLIIFGLLGIVFGSLWHEVFPINKSLWTSSFVLYTAGWALLIFCLLFWLIDVEGIQFWTTPLRIFGVNAITVFFFSGIIPRALNMIKVDNFDGKTIGLQNWFYQHDIAPFFENPKNASLAGALFFVFLWLVILYVMYRKKIFIKV